MQYVWVSAYVSKVCVVMLMGGGGVRVKERLNFPGSAGYSDRVLVLATLQ